MGAAAIGWGMMIGGTLGRWFPVATDAEHGGIGAVFCGGTLLAGGGEQEDFTTVITSFPGAMGRFSTTTISSWSG